MQQMTSLVRLHPDVAELAYWALRKGYLEAGCTDMGYALHAATRVVFGEYAPRPFVLRQLDNRSELLGYSAHGAEAICRVVEQCGKGSAARALNVSSLTVKPMPAGWTHGQKLCFEVRVRPVVRSRLGRLGGTREMDAAAWALRRGEVAVNRNQRYLQWLGKRLCHGGARLLHGSVQRNTKTVVLRRPRKGGKKVISLSNGPDLLVKGYLEVVDPEGFAEGLLRGVGRHTGFGFGCLLLAPADALGPN